MPDEITVSTRNAEEYFTSLKQGRKVRRGGVAGMGGSEVLETPYGDVNPLSVVTIHTHPNGLSETWLGDTFLSSRVDPEARQKYEATTLAERRVSDAEARTQLIEARDAARENAPRILEQGGRVAVYDPATGKITAQTDLLSPAERAQQGQKTEADIAQSEAATEASRATTARQQAETAAIETPQQRQQREMALADQTSANRIAEIRSAKAAELQQMRDLVAGGYQMTREDEVRLQASLQEGLAEITAELQRQTQAQASTLRTQEAEATFEREKPEREATARRAEATLEEQRASNAFTRERAAAEGQAGILTKQAEAGQSLVKGMVASGVAPNRAIVRMALDPLAQAFQIMQGMVREGKIGPEALPTPAAPTPQALPEAPAPQGAPLPQAPLPSATGSLREETERYAAPRPRVGAF